MRLIDEVEYIFDNLNIDALSVLFFSKEEEYGYTYWGSGEVTPKMSGFSLHMNPDSLADFDLSCDIESCEYIIFIGEPTIVVEVKIKNSCSFVNCSDCVLFEDCETKEDRDGCEFGEEEEEEV